MPLDAVNAANAKQMFGVEYGDIVHFDFYVEPIVTQPMSPEQAYELHWRLINFLKEQGFGFDGNTNLTTWKKERERQHGS